MRVNSIHRLHHEALIFCKMDGGGALELLERFPNSRGLFDAAKGGIFFHPSDEDLSLGTPLRKMPLDSDGLGLHQFGNRCSPCMGKRDLRVPLVLLGGSECPGLSVVDLNLKLPAAKSCFQAPGKKKSLRPARVAWAAMEDWISRARAKALRP